jgi:hypothetical protein
MVPLSYCIALITIAILYNMKKYVIQISVLCWMCIMGHTTAVAAPQITEVMYDPIKGGEWVEIYNPDDTPLDLKGWKIFDGTNHTIPGQVIVPAGGYVILADDKSAFISAFSDITTTIIDIVTSFNNDGDTIILRDSLGNDISSMSYTATAGASKNSKSLQNINAEFLPWFPSIGTATTVTKAEIEAATPADPTPTSQPAQPTPTSPYRAWPSDMQLYVSAGGDRVSLAGAAVIFEGKVLSAARKSLPNADLIWTFGDGGSDRGTQVRHTFHYPGSYVVILDVISGEYIAKDQIQVEVVKPNIEVSHVELGEKSYVELYNNTIYDIDIGGFVLEAEGLTGTHFTIPKNTLVLKGRKIIFPSVITKLFIKSDNVVLKFPSGELVAKYAQDSKTIQTEIASSTTPVEDNTPSPQSVASNNPVEIYSKKIFASVFNTEREGETAQSDQSTSTLAIATSTDQATTSTVSSIQSAAVSGAGFDITQHPRILFISSLIIGIAALFTVLAFVDKKEREALGISKESSEIRIIE